MSKDLLYTQCRLRRELPGGTAWQVSWIPAPHAREGQPLRLLIEGIWQEGWVVESVWSSLPEDEVRKLSHLHSCWRERNDG